MPTEPKLFRMVRHPLGMRVLEVKRVVALTPHMRRITFGGADLQGFATLAPEDHVRLFFPEPGRERPVLPTIGPTGIAAPGTEKPIARDYTPRRHDVAARLLDIDFFLHGHGPASAWAARAEPGHVLGAAGPRGSLVLDRPFEWHLFVGDETAIPEIARRIEELPPGTQAYAILGVSAPNERQPLDSRARVTVQWVYRDHARADLSRPFVDALSQLQLPIAKGFTWIAGEAAEARAVYTYLVRDRGFDRALIRASGHWKRGISNHDHHEEIAAT